MLKHALAVLTASKMKGNDRHILTVLAIRANEHGVSWPSLNRIAADTGLDRRTITRHLPKIMAAGELAIERRVRSVSRHRGMKATNRYRILLPVKEKKGAASPPVPDTAGADGPKHGGNASLSAGASCPTSRGSVPPERNRKGTVEYNKERNGGDFQALTIRDYPDIHRRDYSPVAVALTVTGETGNARSAGWLRKALSVIGEDCFRDTIAKLWGEMKAGEKPNNPGADLVKKLKDAASAKGQIIP